MVNPPLPPSIPVPPDGPWIELWLGQPRLARYVITAGGDRALALALYEWNAQISAALQRDLAHVEVALRNAYDLAATNWGGQGHWLRDGQAQVFRPVCRSRSGHRVDLNRKPREQVAQAIADAGGPTAPPGKVIAQLSFGFWRYLSTSAHEKALWVPFLHRAFVPGTNRADVDKVLDRLHRLRNRIAHHEHLLNAGLPARCADIQTVAAALSPDLASYLQTSTTTILLLSHRPTP